MSKIDSFSVKTYADLKRWRDDFYTPAGLNFLIVVGSAGVGKSQMFTPGATEVLYHQGPISGAKFYATLFQNRDKLIVLDDVDENLKKPENINLMKLLGQTEPVKTISRRVQNWQLRKENIPETFKTTSRVCLLVNKVETVDENLAAVLDRGYVVDFKPSMAEVHEQVGTWFDPEHKDIYEFMGTHLSMFTEPSMRSYVKAAKLKELKRDWRQWLLDLCTENKPLAIVGALLNDNSLTSARERKRLFAERGGGCRSTYYEWVKVWNQIHGNVKKTVPDPGLQADPVIPAAAPDPVPPANPEAA
jgi:hypothetical protein